MKEGKAQGCRIIKSLSFRRGIQGEAKNQERVLIVIETGGGENRNSRERF
jgi:hypothetical protein